MSICSRCGNSIEFRYIGGKCIPLHLDGGCLGYGSSVSADYSGYNTSSDSACFSTHCPKCNENVYFIRHNGGSVWIDPPLGPPWYKHSCFETEESQGVRASLADNYQIDLHQLDSEGLLLGVVRSTKVNPDKSHTKALLETGKYETIHLGIKHNAGFVLGKLCVVSENSEYLWPIDAPGLLFKVLSVKKVSSEIVLCPECGVEVMSKNLRKHQKKCHGRT